MDYLINMCCSYQGTMMLQNNGIETITFFISKFMPNFGLRIIILTYAKDFSWKKLPKFARFGFFLSILIFFMKNCIG